jgi:CTP synthase
VGETKTKPTQHSVKELRSIGIQPDILLCRTELQPLPENERKKVSLFTNVEESAIFSGVDVDNIYKIPRELHEQGLDEIVAKKLHLDVPQAELGEWDAVVEAMASPIGKVNIAMVGKYIDLADSYKSLTEALTHAGIQTRTDINVTYVDSEELETNGTGCLSDMDAILVPGGFGNRGIDGKITAAQYARENHIPYLGICLGMQLAVVEFARHQLGFKDANSTEFKRDTDHPVIALITEWMDQNGTIEQRDEGSYLGGTMRLGGQQCQLLEGSRVRELYGQDVITERHRHRYEFNNKYKKQLEDAGMHFTGLSMDSQLVEIIELTDHPWFVACQFHPEFTSTPRDGHPLFSGFVAAALIHHEAPDHNLTDSSKEARNAVV